MPVDLGPFRLDRLASRGSTGEVWQGRHRQQGVPVAVKILSRLVKDEAAQRIFVDEVRAMARLDHPAIIRLHDHGQTPTALVDPDLPSGRPYLVMDWHAGGTLSRLRGRLPFPDLRRVLLTLLDALAYAHARGVVHRDLKPANVLLGHKGPIIADFGLVFGADGDRRRRRGGTPNYMAPEQVRQDWRSFGPWTDLYAFGCLAWALLTDKAPYAGRGAREAMAAHLEGALPPLRAKMPVPIGLEAWLCRLLAPDPAARFRFAADAADALRALPDPDETSVVDMVALLPAERIDPGEPTVLTGPRLDTRDAPAPARSTPGPRVVSSAPIPRIISPLPFPSVPAPPMPDWPRPTPPPGVYLAGCGRALVELRVPALRGRHAERTQLWRRLGDVVRTGRPGVVLIEGAPGVGKSRLMRWLAHRAHETGQADTLYAAHAPVPSVVHGIQPVFARHERLTGLQPESAARRLVSRRVDPAAAVAMAALGAGGVAELGDHRTVLDAETTIFEAVADGLAALCRRRPLVVQLDDAHWGPDTVRCVEHVLDHRPVPVLFVMTVRPGPSPATRDLDLLAHRAEVDRLVLGPLDVEAGVELAGARLCLTRDTADQLTRVTAGNPLFADELLRHWLHIGALDETAGGYRLAPDRPDALPPTLVQLWRSRLDLLLADLRPDPLPGLEIAAILGGTVDLREWSAACARAGVHRPDPACERLLDIGFVRRRGGRLVFVHGQLREALVDRATGAGRAPRWHLACADAIGRIGDGGSLVFDRVRRATHLAAAGHDERAVPVWLEAARERMRRAWHADIRPAIALFDEVLARRPDDGAVLADAAICRARLAWLATGADDRRRLDDAQRFAARAIAAAPALAVPYRAMALVHHYGGRPLTAIRWLEEAIARDAHDADSHELLGRVMAETGPLDRAGHHLEEAIALGRRGVDLRIELARVRAYRGRWDAVSTLLDDPAHDERSRRLADIALSRFRLWKGLDGSPPGGTTPRPRKPVAIAERFRDVVRRGGPDAGDYAWWRVRVDRALGGGAPRRGLLFLQSIAELAGFGAEPDRTLETVVELVDAGLTDRVWLAHCPLLDAIRHRPEFAAAVERLDAALLAADGPRDPAD